MSPGVSRPLLFRRASQIEIMIEPISSQRPSPERIRNQRNQQSQRNKVMGIPENATARLRLLILFLALTGCDDRNKIVETGGNYGPVTREMLIGASYIGRTGKGSQGEDLTWTFEASTFRIKAGASGIPAELSQYLLPEGVIADEIQGDWSVQNDVITFTNIQADGTLIPQKPRNLKTMFTGVLRIVAGRQYKFRRAPLN